MKGDTTRMKFFKNLGSLRINLFLLLVLAGVSIFGTVIVQGENPEFYIKSYGGLIGQTILLINGNDLYNGWPYQGILFCLWINLLICTINSVKPALFKNKKRIALLLIHCSILLIFTGSVVSKFKKDSKYITLLPGQKIELKSENAQIVFNSFDIDYYENMTQPKEYRSNITVKENEALDQEHIIKVNKPFKYKGYGFYQSSFEALADLEMSISHMDRVVWQGNWKQGESLILPGDSKFRLEITHFIPDAHVDQEGTIMLRSYKLGNTALLISMYRDNELVGSEWIFSDKKINDMIGQKIEVFDFSIKRVDIFYATIIQVIKDPGLIFVWVGFFMLFVGMTLFLFIKKLI